MAAQNDSSMPLCFACRVKSLRLAHLSRVSDIVSLHPDLNSISRQASAECVRSATVMQQATLVSRLSSQVRIKLLATEIPPAFREIRVGTHTHDPCRPVGRATILADLISYASGSASCSTLEQSMALRFCESTVSSR